MKVDFTTLFGIVIGALTIVALYREYLSHKKGKSMSDRVSQLENWRTEDIETMKNMDKRLKNLNTALKKKSAL